MPLLRALLAPAQRSKRMGRLDGRRTAAGVTVTPEKAMQVNAVYSCVRLLAESGSGLPISALRKTSGGRRPADDHPHARLLHEPNPNMDGDEYRRLVFAFQALRGNAFGYMERQQNGRVHRLWPIRPTSVTGARLNDGSLAYDVELDDDEYAPLRGVKVGNRVRVRREDMLHYRALGWGDFGLSPIALARQTVGTSYAAQAYVGGFFERDASPGGVVSVPGELSDTQYDRLTEQWQDLHEGFDRSHRLAILEGGASWAKVGLAPADAAFLEIHKLGRTDIASMYNIPAFMIGSEEATTWGTGIEQMSLGYVIYALAPFLTRYEKETARLFGPRDGGYYVRINTGGLLRGDLQSRYAAYATGRQWGWLSVNDILAREDEDPIGPDGDQYLQPLNMVPAGTTAPPAARASHPAPAPVPVPVGWRRQVRVGPIAERFPAHLTGHREALEDYFTAQRDELLAALTAPGERSVRDAAAAWVAAADRSWDEQLAEILLRLALALAGDLGPTVAGPLGGSFTTALMRLFFEDETRYAAETINRTTAEKVARLMEDPDVDPVDALTELFAGFLESRVPQLAEARVQKVGNVTALEAGRQAGATTKTWVAVGGSRPTHQAANGQTVGIDDEFTVGAARGRYPRDHRLGVDEIAGCDCTMTLQRDED
ncbi:phage portal protein [Pseudonocardia hispaniensis]|uniref:Phage portal protein n=1 Tax=Pseudonocardia hispaniensis TaxID=904933 RepID=A0ABW1IZ12_9PSEU